MSLAETQELMTTMQEIIRLLDGAEVKVAKIQETVGGDRGTRDLSLRSQLRILNVMSTLISDMSGGNKDINYLQSKINQTSMAFMRLYMLAITIQELQAGIIGGPLGIAYGVANLIGFGIALNTLGQ
jgi:hypothetical protein